MSGNYISIGAVREHLRAGFELNRYRETRNTFAGWAINNFAVHGNTVIALIRRGDVDLVVLSERERRRGWITHRARPKKNGGAK